MWYACIIYVDGYIVRLLIIIIMISFLIFIQIPYIFVVTVLIMILDHLVVLHAPLVWLVPKFAKKKYHNFNLNILFLFCFLSRFFMY